MSRSRVSEKGGDLDNQNEREGREDFWKIKLASWLHDPLEKALILGRTEGGHEGGNVADFRKKFFPDGMGSAKKILKKADWWASAADRPQWPQEGGRKTIRASFVTDPVFIHPLSGERYEISSLQTIDHNALIREVGSYLESLDTFEAKKTLLSFWRFAPEISNQKEGEAPLGLLWNLLPADTRVPDHSIWNHLDLTSAFSGAMAGDPDEEPALLVFSLGPVQSFIELGRSLSDLWAGSHFLSSLAWEAMAPLCEELGPDAVLFPQLRGLPLVDRWLIDKMGLDPEQFVDADWNKGSTDSNPFYVASLPNKFVALVPASRARELALSCAGRAKEWAHEIARKSLDMVLEEAEARTDGLLYCDEQLDRQMKDFPEVSWSIVPWSLVLDEKEGIETQKIENIMSHFSPDGGWAGKAKGVWKEVLSKPHGEEGGLRYAPNPGVLYPALYELLDRTLAAAKSQRSFSPHSEKGYRDSLGGEREWLAEKKEDINLSPGKRTSTLWERVAKKRPSWVKKGEHLDSLGLIKRLWPTIFTKEISSFVKSAKDSETFPPNGGGFTRYVLSTHTMALSGSLEKLLEGGPEIESQLQKLLGSRPDAGNGSPLPRKLVMMKTDEKRKELIRRVVSRIDGLDDDIDGLDDDEIKEKRDRFLRQFEGVLGHSPEDYYALLLCDGDDMGAWLSGGRKDFSMTYRESWHPKVLEEAGKVSGFDRYLDSDRAMSPGRHAAVSTALSNFASLAPRLVEEFHLGKLLYAGGDDLMAMVSLRDLLEVMTDIRGAYSGAEFLIEERSEPESRQGRKDKDITCKNGFVLEQRGRRKVLRMMMGKKASLSMGVVVAHHQDPLGKVLRALRKAEKKAKAFSGKDAFSISLLKRSGGASHLTLPWRIEGPDSPILALDRLSRVLGSDLSRRATYIASDWIKKLPGVDTMKPADYFDMIRQNLAYQFGRQSEGMRGDDWAATVVGAVEGLFSDAQTGEWSSRAKEEGEDPRKTLTEMLTVAEFLGRKGRRHGK